MSFSLLFGIKQVSLGKGSITDFLCQNHLAKVRHFDPRKISLTRAKISVIVSNKVKNGAKTAKIVPKRATDRLKGARNSVFGPKNSLFFAKTI